MFNEHKSISRDHIISEWRQMQENTELSLRSQLTTLYKIIENNGWGDAIFTHCSVRLPNGEAFLQWYIIQYPSLIKERVR